MSVIEAVWKPDEVVGETKAEETAAPAAEEAAEVAPGAAERGFTGYMFWAEKQREAVREENPGAQFGQIGKILGERWKALSDEERAPYEAQALARQKEHDEEKRAKEVSV